MSRETVERQAKLLARENRRAEPDIERIFWFPDDQEVRLVETTSSVPRGDNAVRPFYFRPQPQDELPAPSGVAMINPADVRRARLPQDWGDWDSAVELNGEE
jgi:hypothetical protein